MKKTSINKIVYSILSLFLYFSLLTLISCEPETEKDISSKNNFSTLSENGVQITIGKLSDYNDEPQLSEAIGRMEGKGFELDTFQIGKFTYQHYTAYNFYVKNSPEGKLNKIVSGYVEGNYLNDILLEYTQITHGDELIGIHLYSDGNCYGLYKSAEYVDEHGQTVASRYYFEETDCPDGVKRAPNRLEDINPSTVGSGENNYGTPSNPAYAGPSYGSYPVTGAYTTVDVNGGPTNGGYFTGIGGGEYYPPGTDPGRAFPNLPGPENNIGVSLTLFSPDKFFEYNYLNKPNNANLKDWWEDPANSEQKKKK
ncbi:hypothetical protein ACFSO9_13340 [Mesonia maritima]|uniref:hypothetical protein n=1 Tax=Mesonia maritima TaxID=1793873 RepID=UPI00363D1250